MFLIYKVITCPATHWQHTEWQTNPSHKSRYFAIDPNKNSHILNWPEFPQLASAGLKKDQVVVCCSTDHVLICACVCFLLLIELWVFYNLFMFLFICFYLFIYFFFCIFLCSVTLLFFFLPPLQDTCSVCSAKVRCL